MKLSGFTGAGIMVTYRCNAACRHCCYSSSPERDGHYMSSEMADYIFSSLYNAGCRSCHIGGGEPFLDIDSLCAVCESAARSRVEIEYIETNAGWANSEAETHAILRKVLSAGVNTLLISCDPFHNEFIPLKNVITLANTCDLLGAGYFIWQRQYLDKLMKPDIGTVHSPDELTEIFGRDYLKKSSSAYGMNVNGRAIQLYRQFTSAVEYTAFLDNSPCRGLSGTSHFHVDPDGWYIPPGCIGFRLPLDDAINGFEDASYPFYSTAAKYGINGLFESARTLGFSPEDKYTSKCELCFELKKHIQKVTNAPEFGPVDFLTKG